MLSPLAGWALLSFSIGIGYLICLKASKEGSKLFKYGGYVIGILMLVISLALLAEDHSRRRGRRTPPRRSGPSSRKQRQQTPKLPPELEEMIRKQQQAQPE